MLEVEVDDFGQRVHLGGLKVANELCQTFLKLRIYTISVVFRGFHAGNAYKQQAQSSSFRQW